MTIATDLGPAIVRHRLAVGVECIDALTERHVETPVVVRREPPSGIESHGFRATQAPIDFESSGLARFKLRHDGRIGSTIFVRVDDQHRRYVPRRFEIRPWAVNQLDETAGAPYVRVRNRVLTTVLWPGTAYSFAGGTTLIRGRVMRDGRPARWTRVQARTLSNLDAGAAHVDDRGEFVLPVVELGQNPLRSTATVVLSVFGPRVIAPTDSRDRCADLDVESVDQTAVLPGPLVSTGLVRHVTVPSGFVRSRNQPTRVVAIVGTELILTEDLVFNPQP
jgi:hypothetical protein